MFLSHVWTRREGDRGVCRDDAQIVEILEGVIFVGFDRLLGKRRA
jgi:hypothetical protein